MISLEVASFFHALDLWKRTQTQSTTAVTPNIVCVGVIIINNLIFFYTRASKKSETLGLKPAESTLTHTHIHTCE